MVIGSGVNGSVEYDLETDQGENEALVLLLLSPLLLMLPLPLPLLLLCVVFCWYLCESIWPHMYCNSFQFIL